MSNAPAANAAAASAAPPAPPAPVATAASLPSPIIVTPSGGRYRRSYSDIRGPWEERKIPIVGVAKSFVSQLQIGQDMTRVSMPSIFFRPYSFLEDFAARDLSYFPMTFDIASKTDPLDRMVNVLQWIISRTREENFNHKPYNPLLGEINMCHLERESASSSTPYSDSSSSYYVNEQVTHHPPNTAFMLLNKTHKVTFNGNYSFVIRFRSNSVVATTTGGAEFIIHNDDGSDRENYHMDKAAPDLVVKNTILPGRKYVVWVGKVTLYCEQTGLSAEITFEFDLNYINTFEAYIYKHSTPIKRGEPTPETAKAVAYLRGRVGHELYRLNFTDAKPLSSIPEHERHEKWHRAQHLQALTESAEAAAVKYDENEETPEKKKIEKPKEQGYGSWMWKGLTAATTAVASTVAPSYMKDPDSDPVATSDDVFILDYSKIPQCQGLYPEFPDERSPISLWAPLSVHLLTGDLEKADEAKKKIEESQRERARLHKEAATTHQPKYFEFDKTKNGWRMKAEHIENIDSVFSWKK